MNGPLDSCAWIVRRGRIEQAPKTASAVKPNFVGSFFFDSPNHRERWASLIKATPVSSRAKHCLNLGTLGNSTRKF